MPDKEEKAIEDELNNKFSNLWNKYVKKIKIDFIKDDEEVGISFDEFAMDLEVSKDDIRDFYNFALAEQQKEIEELKKEGYMKLKDLEKMRKLIEKNKSLKAKVEELKEENNEIEKIMFDSFFIKKKDRNKKTIDIIKNYNWLQQTNKTLTKQIEELKKENKELEKK